MSAFHTVPLYSLAISPLNVRPLHDDDGIDSLAADILARGLLTPLIVHPNPNTLSVVTNLVAAGGRRFTALMRLMTSGAIDRNYRVDVLVKSASTDAELSEISLAENVQRRNMNPGDEAVAFKWLADQGCDEESIARRMGSTTAHVGKRLRLAVLSPVVLDALRAEIITLDAANAYASTTNHRDQEAEFKKQAKDKYRPHNVSSIRDSLRGRTYAADSAIVEYVGLALYVTAGGRMVTDLFTDGAHARLLDTDIIDRLAIERGAGEALALAKKAKVTGGVLVANLAETQSYGLKMPKAPAGHVGIHSTYGIDNTLATIMKRKFREVILVYRLKLDETGVPVLTASDRACFVPLDSADAPPPASAQLNGYVQPKPLTAEEQAARETETRTVEIMLFLAASEQLERYKAGETTLFFSSRLEAHNFIQYPNDKPKVSLEVRPTRAEVESHREGAVARLSIGKFIAMLGPIGAADFAIEPPVAAWTAPDGIEWKHSPEDKHDEAYWFCDGVDETFATLDEVKAEYADHPELADA